MKKIFKILAVVLSSFLSFSCYFLTNSTSKNDYFPGTVSENQYSNSKTYAVGDTAGFYLCGNSDESTYELRDFKLVSIGEHYNAWLVSLDSTYMQQYILTEDEVKEIATVFDENYSKMISIFGSNEYSGVFYSNIVSSYSGKVNLLFYDIYGDSSASQTGGTFGFFTAQDFISMQPSEDSVSPLNKTEALHIDSYFSKLGPVEVKLTILHEFNHLLNYINKYITIRNSSYYESWFTEMLSMLAEDILATKVSGVETKDTPFARIPYFNYYYPLGFKNWRNTKNYYPNGDNLVSYANAYVFGAYLLRRYGDLELIHKIATNTSINEAAITQALKDCNQSADFESVLKEECEYLTDYDSTLYDKLTDSFDGEQYTLNPFPTSGKYGLSLSIWNSPDSGKNLWFASNASLVMGPYGFLIQDAGSVSSVDSLQNKDDRISVSKVSMSTKKGTKDCFVKVYSTLTSDSSDIAYSKTGIVGTIKSFSSAFSNSRSAIDDVSVIENSILRRTERNEPALKLVPIE